MIRRRRLRSAAPCRFIAGVPGVLDPFGFGFDSFSKKELPLALRPVPPGSREISENPVAKAFLAPDGSMTAQ